MASNNYIYKMSNAGGMATVTRYTDMLAGNTTWSPWEPDGAFDALATVTVPSGGVASIEFAGIPNTYKHLQIRWLAKMSLSGVLTGINLRINNDTGSNYRRHTIYGDGSTVTASSGSDFWCGFIPRADSTSVFGTGITDVLDYTSTTKNKTVRTLNGTDQNGSGAVGLFSGLYFATPTAITSLTMFPDSGNFTQYSQFTLYGIK
jgi:hypothetical protein